MTEHGNKISIGGEVTGNLTAGNHNTIAPSPVPHAAAKAAEPRLFVSYRNDSGYATAAIIDRLTRAFGVENVFRDRDSLAHGSIYSNWVRRALERSDVVVVVMGQSWLEIRDSSGKRCLDDPQDWIRAELRIAFELAIPVVPVLLDDTPLPGHRQLPDDIAELTLSTFWQVRHQSFESDIRGLIDALTNANGGRATTGYHDGGIIRENVGQVAEGHGQTSPSGARKGVESAVGYDGEDVAPFGDNVACPAAGSTPQARTHDEAKIVAESLWSTSVINTTLTNSGGAKEASDTLPISIFVDDERHAATIERALLGYLDAVGIEIVASGEPRIGSWSRWFMGRKGRENVDALDLAWRAVEMQAFDKEQAEIDTKQATAVAALVSALGDVENAAINIGSVLLMKIDGQLIVRNLSQEEMILIKRKSSDLISPKLLLRALEEFACADGRGGVRSSMAISATSEESSGDSQLNSA